MKREREREREKFTRRIRNVQERKVALGSFFFLPLDSMQSKALFSFNRRKKERKKALKTNTGIEKREAKVLGRNLSRFCFSLPKEIMIVASSFFFPHEFLAQKFFCSLILPVLLFAFWEKLSLTNLLLSYVHVFLFDTKKIRRLKKYYQERKVLKSSQS